MKQLNRESLMNKLIAKDILTDLLTGKIKTNLTVPFHFWLVFLLGAVGFFSWYALSKNLSEMKSGAILLVCLLALWRMSTYGFRAYKESRVTPNRCTVDGPEGRCRLRQGHTGAHTGSRVELELGVIPPLYPFREGEECPTCHCVYHHDPANPLGYIRPGCHCVCHD